MHGNAIIRLSIALCVVSALFFLIASLIRTQPTTKTAAPAKTIKHPAPRMSAAQHKIETKHRHHFENLQENFRSQLNKPYGFATDPFQQKLIWTSSGDESFKLANFDQTEVISINSNFKQPPHLKVGTSYGYSLFYMESGLVKKREVDYQLGTESEVVLLEIGDHKVHGMGFDEALGVLYLGDELGRPKRAILLSGNGEEIIVKTITQINPLPREE